MIEIQNPNLWPLEVWKKEAKMNFKRMWALFIARNYEFIRDKAGFGWNILFPFLIVAAFGFIFSNDTSSDYKIGIFPVQEKPIIIRNLNLPDKLKSYKHISIIPFENLEKGLDKLEHHKIDILLENQGPELRYWVNSSSPKSYIAETIVKESVIPEQTFSPLLVRKEVIGDRIRYIDWLFPGIIGMNIMFSSLYGVGYIIVRYRRIGVLKRLMATPVTAFEYLTAQLLSRTVVMLGSVIVVWLGCHWIFSLKINGSYIDILFVLLAGIFCLSSLGMLLACRGTNEELTNGIINFITWPMMILSEIWFSLEGASDTIKTIAKIFPLTHFLAGARKIVNDGASLTDISFEIAVLIITGFVCLVIGSFLFSWTE
jgi:ABC-2 type transport system permease protein